jgi:hypothetical protein
MADIGTLPTGVDPEVLKRLAALSGGLQPIGAAQPTPAPAMPIHAMGHENSAKSDLGLKDAIARTNPGVTVSSEKITPLELGKSDAAPTATTLSPIGGSPGPLKPLGFKERQDLPTTSAGAPAGSSAFYQGKLQRIEDQKANPWGSADNHPGILGKIGHVAGRIGNIAGDVLAPATMQLIPGTDLNRQSKELGAKEGFEQASTRESQEASRKANQAYQEGEAARGNRAQDLAERKEDFEEGKPAKPGTPDEQAIAAKMKEVNPDTQKPFTAYEARVQLANDIKPEGNQPPHTVTMLDKEGGKPYTYQYDPKGNYSGDAGRGQWKKVGPAQANTATLGLVGTMQPLLNPDGSFSGKTFNNKTGTIGNVDTSGLNGASTGTGARLKNTENNQFNTQYIKPATDTETNFQKAQTAMDEYRANPQSGAAGMVELSQHIATTLGGVKGVSVGENMIHEHENAIGLADRASRYIDQLQTGQPLSATQMADFNKLIHETRDIVWKVAAKEGSRRGQKINFLPSDVQVNLVDSTGKARPVPGDKVQQYLDKGAKIQ